MPDTITEFYNADIALTDLADDAEITLLTTSASETAVIKDIMLVPTSGLLTESVTLEVNNTNIATLTGDSNYSGTELVGVSSTVNLKKTGNAYNDINMSVWTGTGGDLIQIEVGRLKLAELPLSTSTTSIGGTQTTDKYIQAHMDASDTYLTVGYWNGNNTNGIKKYLVSDGSTVQTGTVSTYNGLPHYGGDNFYYWINGTTLYRMATDDASAQVTNWSTGTYTGAGASTYPLFSTNTEAASNGERCVIVCSASSTDVYANIMDATTGTRTVSNLNIGEANGPSTFWDEWGTGVMVLPFYSTTNSAWMILYSESASGVVRLAYLPTAAGVPTTIATMSVANENNVTGVLSVSNDSIFHLDENTGTLSEYDLNLKLVATPIVTNANLISLTNSQTPIISVTTPSSGTIAGRDYSGTGSYRVRATGIKTT